MLSPTVGSGGGGVRVGVWECGSGGVGEWGSGGVGMMEWVVGESGSWSGG
jgi:hypothetical protein